MPVRPQPQDQVAAETATDTGPCSETRDDVTLTEPSDDAPPPARGPRRAVRVARACRSALVTASAGLLVLFALVAPNTLGLLTPKAFLRVPLEALLGFGLLMLLPGRARQVVAVLAGACLGLLAIIKGFDMGFFKVLARPFDPVLDWALLDDAVGVLRESIGPGGARAVAVATALLGVGVLVLTALSVMRLARLAVRHSAVATSGIAVLALTWTTCAMVGAQIVPGVPVASRSASLFAYTRAVTVNAGLRDRQAFAAQAALDPFEKTPGEELLTGLRGKDVLLAFVESYGRSAVENPELASEVNAVLDDGTRRLAAAGFSARSGFLTSPTAGGGSWLAHSTLLSGLWIDNQQRYRTFVSSDRLTLNSAFRRANWRTVGMMPGVTRAWPEGKIYHYDTVYDSHSLGYRGPNFSWAPVPDQYTLQAFERLERGKPGRGPIMAEFPMVSSHGPWAPLPKMIDWEDVGDGSVYRAIAAQGRKPDDVWKDTTQIRAAYRSSIAYSLTSLISYVERYGDDSLVLVFLGDHQPAPLVTGEGAGRDVPITLVTRNQAVLDRVSSWGWDEGLRPGPHAPVWPMNAFRDRFLTTFSS